jgi:hypothetical protein
MISSHAKRSNVDDQPIAIDPLAFAMRTRSWSALTLGALQLPQQGAVDGVYVES